MTSRKTYLIPLGLMLFTNILAREATMNFQHHLMPVPRNISPGEGRFQLEESFKVGRSGNVGSKTITAVSRMLRRLSDRTGLFFEQYQILDNSQDSKPDFIIKCEQIGNTVLGEDESYVLEVTPSGVFLSAVTELGVIHGIETFLQLMEAGKNGYYFPAVKIEDAPRFRWRGLMIDVCRHFQPIEVIKRNLDAMVTVKLNVLHLHLSEDQGFRIECKNFPKLHAMGSDGLFFTQEQIKEIIAYADVRGIRVIPEFDMPSHSTSWFVGYPHLASIDSTYTIERGWGIKDPAMDPTKESTYEFLDAFIGEMAALFPDQYFHIGGDENNGKHWSRNPDIQTFMKEKGFSTTHELQSYFIKRIREIVRKQGKKMIGWDEIYDPEMPKDIVTQYWSWEGMERLQSSLELGYQAIISNGYYIDLFWSTDRHYLNDPYRERFLTDESLEKNILGGEIPSWAEFVTPELIDSRIWPRTAAIAERLWSPKDVRDVDDLYRRLEIVSFQLEEVGLTHIRNVDMMLRRLSNNADIMPLKIFIDVVEPIEDYSRHHAIEDRKYTSFSPLTRVVDIASSDAKTAREFRKIVDEYLIALNRIKEKKHKSYLRRGRKDYKQLQKLPVRKEIHDYLLMWQQNHGNLQSVIDQSAILKEIESLSADLAQSATIGLEALDYIESGQTAPDDWSKEKLLFIEKAREQRGEVELRILTALEKLVKVASGLFWDDE